MQALKDQWESMKGKECVNNYIRGKGVMQASGQQLKCVRRDEVWPHKKLLNHGRTFLTE